MEHKSYPSGVALRGTITYSDEYGHVCTCTEATEYDDDGYPSHASYLPTVQPAPEIAMTETGSAWYVCKRCGAGGWSGL